MDSPLARALRDAATAPLPPRAFLRRDRGEALFVTDAPSLRPDVNWAEILSAAGFRCVQRGAVLALSPGPGWLTELEAGHPLPPDALSAALLRYRGLPPEAESLKLFALGARCLDAATPDGRFDRLLRQRAAECMRLNRTHPTDPPRGGGLYACALLDHELEVLK